MEEKRCTYKEFLAAIPDCPRCSQEISHVVIPPTRGDDVWRTIQKLKKGGKKPWLCGTHAAWAQTHGLSVREDQP
jgi:hypothetical protein